MGNAVGLAIAEEVFKKRFEAKLVDHKAYVIASDGDLMEGISHENEFSWHLKLKNLIVFLIITKFQLTDLQN